MLDTHVPPWLQSPAQAQGCRPSRGPLVRAPGGSRAAAGAGKPGFPCRRPCLAEALRLACPSGALALHGREGGTRALAPQAGPWYHRGPSLELPLSSTVTKSKCPSYVGVTGILLQETKHVFKIITKEDRLKGMSLCLPGHGPVASRL